MYLVRLYCGSCKAFDEHSSGSVLTLFYREGTPRPSKPEGKGKVMNIMPAYFLVAFLLLSLEHQKNALLLLLASPSLAQWPCIEFLHGQLTRDYILLKKTICFPAADNCQ